MDYVWGLFDTDGYDGREYTRIRKLKNGFKEFNEPSMVFNQSGEVGKTMLLSIQECLTQNEVRTNGLFKTYRNTGNQIEYRMSVAPKSHEKFLSLHPKEMTREYIAGIIDGDGTFNFDTKTINNREYKYPRLELMAKKERKWKLFDSLQIFLNKEIGTSLKNPKIQKNGKKYYQWYNLEAVKIAKYLDGGCIKKENIIREILDT